MSLAALLDQATPGPWIANRVGATAGQTIRASGNRPVAWLAPEDRDSLGIPGARGAERAREAIALTDADARLIALAPDMARLLVDMAAWMSTLMADEAVIAEPRALLARFAEIERGAAQ